MYMIIRYMVLYLIINKVTGYNNRENRLIVITIIHVTLHIID